MDDKPIYFGGAIKAADNGIVEGYLVRFTDGQTRDLHGQYFTKNTDFHFGEGYGVKGERTMYQHGLDMKLGVRRIGRVTDMKIDDLGMWIQAQIELNDEYNQAIYDLAKDGRLAWSSGALPQSVDYTEEGEIKSWAIIEASLTPSPAQPFLTRIQTLKAIEPVDLLRGAQPRGVEQDTANGDVEASKQIEIETPDSGTTGDTDMTPEQVKELLLSLLAEMGITPGSAEEKAAEEVMLEEAQRADASLPEEELMKSVVIAGVKAVNAAREKRQAVVKGAVAGIVNAAKNEPGQSAIHSVGQNGGGSRVQVGANLKYDHLSAADMALGVMLLQANAPKGVNLPLSMLGVSEEYMKHLAHKTVGELDKGGFKRVQDTVAVKSVLPFKAQEIDASNIATQGQEWVTNFYSSTLWEKARELRIYDELVRKGIMEQEIPDGASTAYFPTEENDPVAYTRNQAQSLDSGARPETTVNINPFTTSNVSVSPSEVALATSYTTILQEDSIIPIANQVNRQVNEKMLETLEQLLINGDTATSASANINLIDSTPGTGLQKPYYLATNGFLKLPLVTATSYSRDGGALDEDDYISTYALLPSAIRARKDKLVFVIDPDTELKTMQLPSVKTRDVNSAATIESGQLTKMWGIPLMTSGFMLKANTAGKISVTAGNNTKGRILLVYAPYWGIAWKRRITIEQEYSALSGTYVYVASFRMGVVARANTAAAVSYNLTV